MHVLGCAMVIYCRPQYLICSGGDMQAYILKMQTSIERLSSHVYVFLMVSCRS